MLRARGRSVATVWVPAAFSDVEDSLREMRATPKEPSESHEDRSQRVSRSVIRGALRAALKIARLSSF